MHPFQTSFQPLFCLCVYYLLLLYIQTISSVAAVHFFFHKNGNYPHLEFVRCIVPFCVIPLLPAALWGSTEFTSVTPPQPEGLVWSHLPLYLLSCYLYLWTAQLSSPRLNAYFLPSPTKSLCFCTLFLPVISSELDVDGVHISSYSRTIM